MLGCRKRLANLHSPPGLFYAHTILSVSPERIVDKKKMFSETKYKFSQIDEKQG